MRVFATLLRKHWVENRWLLGLSAAFLFGLAWLTSWVGMRFERVVAEGDLGRAFRQFRFIRALGGPAMDESNYATIAVQVCWWNHPVFLLTVLAWAITRGASAVAGEIERGTVDVTLSRPVSRTNYLASQIGIALLGLLLLAGALVVGDLLAARFYHLKEPPSLAAMLRPATMLVTLGLAVFGYTLPFSAVDVVRWRASVAGAAITLGGLIAMTVAPQFEGYDWLERLSVFRAYAPVTVAVKGEPLAYNATVLGLIFLAGCLVSLALFARRDIPSNS